MINISDHIKQFIKIDIVIIKSLRKVQYDNLDNIYEYIFTIK